MKVQVLQHVPFEDIGSMGEWLAARRASVGYTRFFADWQLPQPDGLDLVIAMGGPMSVNDEAAHPWLRAEKEFLRAVVQREVPLVGICLGAQLIAGALGARVYPGAEKEIGWFPIHPVPAPGRFSFPASAEVFHWHGETFDLPPGAALLASSTACRNQAFQLGDRVLGLQFHLETTPESLDALVVNSRHELIGGTFLQDETTLRAKGTETFARINRLMNQVLDYVTRPA